MASLKIKYRHSSIEGKAGTLFYQVIHNRVARQINSGYKIYPDEWDIFNSQIIIPAKTGENRHRYLVSLKKCIEEDTSRLKDIMIRFENLGYKYTADEIIEYYSAPPVNEYFVSFCENLIEELRQIGKIRTTETYTTTLNSFKSGKSISYQVHRHRDEVWTFIDGEGELVLDDIRSVISRGDTITIKKGVKHAVRAISELTFIEVQSGNLLAEEDIEQFDYKW